MVSHQRWSRNATHALALVAAIALLPTARATAEPNPSAARGRIAQAKIALESDDVNDADDRLVEAEKFLDGAPDNEKKPILGQIDEMRATFPEHRKVAKARRAAEVQDRIDSLIRNADEAVNSAPFNAKQSLDVADERLKADDVRAALDEDAIKKTQERIAASRKKVAEVELREAFGRATPPMEELEQKLKSDPFKAQGEMSAYRVATDLNALETRVRGALQDQPRSDPQVKAIFERLAKADEKVAAASKKWGVEQAEERVTSSWKATRNDLGDWEGEAATAPSERTFGDLSMPKTIHALRLAGYWLGNTELKKLRDEYKDDAAIKAAFTEAEKVVADAGKKLNDAFNAMMIVGEKMPVPHKRSLELSRPSRATAFATSAFEGTPHQDANVKRAQALQTKWEAELKRREEASAALKKQLSAQADADWAKIDPSIRAANDFDPTDAMHWKDRAIRLKAVRNRSGWDDDGKWGFMMKLNGVYVAGNYESKVSKAMGDACDKIDDSIDDHINWDVIAIVEGTDTVNQRVKTDIIDAGTRDRIGQIESYPPVPCVKVRVIALHAGPVAVGP